MPLKLIFMGTPEFSLRTLEKIIDSEHKVECVYTQSPKKKSRGQKIKKSPVHLFAEKFSIPVRTPDKLDNNVELEYFLKINPDVVVVVAYGKILPDKLLNIPKTVINIGNSKYIKADSVGLSSKTFSKEGGGLSGKSLYSNTLKTVKLISSKYDLPIIATGGVSSYDNVKELLDNGATLTGMATLLVSDPFQIPLINYRLSND